MATIKSNDVSIPDFEGFGATVDLMQFSQDNDPQAMCNSCNSCGKDIDGSEIGLQCQICLKYYHLKCNQISSKLYECWKEAPKNVSISIYIKLTMSVRNWLSIYLCVCVHYRKPQF